MKIVVIIIAVILLLVITFQYFKIKMQSAILDTVSSMQDIIYWCDTKPTMKYKFLSDSVDYQLGAGSKLKHLKNPKLVFDVIHPEDRHLLESKLNGSLDFRKSIVVRLQHANGEYYWFEEASIPIYKNGEYVAIKGVYRRIDEHMKKLKEIEYELSYDTLTAVYNRTYFEKMMEYYNRHSIKVGMAIVDLDNLKLVNDRLGHRSGDEFIATMGDILKSNATEQISVCRIGGDEFAIFFEQATVVQIENYFEAVHAQLIKQQQDIVFANIDFSRGYALVEDSYDNMEHLYEAADKNMYVHKRSKEVGMEFQL